jgi:hypothetical protein
MKYGVIYNVFINGFIIVVILANAFVMIRFTRKSVYEGYRNSHLIHRVISIHRLYVILWTIFQLSNFVFVFLDNQDVRIAHGVIMALYPMIVSISFLFSIMKNKQTISVKNYNKIPLIAENELSTSSEGESNEKNPNKIIDSMQILNPNSDGKKHISPSDNAFEYQESNGYWDITDNFKEVLRKEVLEYIVKAFDVLFEVHRRGDDDKINVKATMIDLKLDVGGTDNMKTDESQG